MTVVNRSRRRTVFLFLWVFAVLACIYLVVLVPFGGSSMVASADGTALTPPITQDWANTGLITADDNWSGVPGIIGYRGDSLTSSPGSDPQLTVADGSSTPVDVNANRNDPDTFISGGVSEFELVNPVVALNGSGTADAPHLVVHVNSTGFSGINVAYNLRDLDGSADNSVQAVALQYRVGGSGNYVNVPLGFVADATTGPSQATLVTPVSVTLPAACDNQPLVQIRIISNDAVGNDEWVGVDDINITAGGGGGGVISGSGAANPTTAAPGAATLLTVTVNPATTPPSTGIAVVGNLTPIAGSSTQTFFDDGSNGDVTGGDNIFSFLATVGAAVPTGQKTIVATITDAQLRTANALITLTVQVPPSSDDHITMGNPSGATADIGTPLNYLMTKPQYILSYNRDDGRPNWVSWHLDTTWLGSAPRQDDFRPDTSLPAGWYQVLQTDYSGSGFDRGHHTPSADRTSSIPDNSATFFMTNMMPQAPDNNQGPWEQLESYSRTLVNAGNELYIIMGGAGIGGTGSNGPATTVANGHVTVPARTWKVIIVLPVGNNDVSRVNKNTRVIAVNMPNTQGIRTMDWRTFRVSVDSLEALTTYNFFSNVSVMTQSAIEKRADIVP